MWNNIIEAGRPQVTVWSMHIACQIPKSTNTISQYAILTAFQLEQWLLESASLLHYSTLPAVLSFA